MPESISRAMTLRRIRSEALNADETLLSFVRSADIVRLIPEGMTFIEDDNQDYWVSFNWVKQEVLRAYETKITLLGVGVSNLIKLVAETLNFSETLVRRTELVSDVILKIRNETLIFVDSWTEFVRGRQRVKTYYLQVRETLPYYVGKYAVIDETLNIAEDTLNLVIAVANELVKVIRRPVYFNETRSRLRARTRIRNEIVNFTELRKAVLPAALIQLVGDFVVKPLYTAVFSINKDVNR